MFSCEKEKSKREREKKDLGHLDAQKRKLGLATVLTYARKEINGEGKKVKRWRRRSAEMEQATNGNRIWTEMGGEKGGRDKRRDMWLG